MENCKVLFYSANPYEGGAVKFFVELVNNFSTDVHKIVVINKKNTVASYGLIGEPILRVDIDTIYDKRIPKHETKSLALKVLQKAYRVCRYTSLFITNIRKFQLLLRELNVDGVYSSSGGYPGDESCLQLLIAAKIVNVENRILILHNYIQARSGMQKMFYFFLDRVIALSATKIVTVSNVAKKYFDDYAYFRKDVSVIYNGMAKHGTRSKEEKKGILGLRSEFVIGMIGNIETRKGHIYLIKAFHLLKTRLSNMDIKLVIIGNIFEKTVYQQLCQYIKENSLKDEVIFRHGIVSAGEYAECFDIMVFPSIAFESFGLVALEGMMYGIPVIGFDVGGIPDVITNDVTGYLVENKNYSDLSEKMLKLVKYQETRKELGENALKDYQKRFTLDIMIKKYEALMEYS